MSTSMRLIHQGKVLSQHDTSQLSHVGIKSGSFIQVEHAGALKGGSHSKKRVLATDSDDEFVPAVKINTGI